MALWSKLTDGTKTLVLVVLRDWAITGAVVAAFVVTFVVTTGAVRFLIGPEFGLIPGVVVGVIGGLVTAYLVDERLPVGERSEAET